jgi:hypothetical protein
MGMTDEEILRQRVSEETQINRVLTSRLEKAERALKDISELYGEDCSLARTIANRYLGIEERSK